MYPCMYILLHSPDGCGAASCEPASCCSPFAVCLAVSLGRRCLSPPRESSVCGLWSQLFKKGVGRRTLGCGAGGSGLSSAPTSQLLRGGYFCRQGMRVSSELSPLTPSVRSPPCRLTTGPQALLALRGQHGEWGVMLRSPQLAFPYFLVCKQASSPGLWDKPFWGAGAWIWGGKWCKRGPWLRSHFSEKCQCFREAAFPPPHQPLQPSFCAP